MTVIPTTDPAHPRAASAEAQPLTILTARRRADAGLADAGTVQRLLCQRADLPAVHPDRATLRARSIEAGLPLARRLASRYQGRGEPFDDLYQVAALALVHAVDHYDPAQRTAFAAYATPTILGALKRHFRDTTWLVRAPRRVQELAMSITSATAILAQQLGRTATRRELAVHLDASERAVDEARNARHARWPTSLDATLTRDDEDPRHLVDTLGAADAHLEAVTDRETLQLLLAALTTRQRSILGMRFVVGLTQADIAVQVGVSQMQVSRLLARTLADLRTGMLAGPSAVTRPPALNRRGPATRPARST
jgi:RNA polymerase sigma-B factor